MNTNKIATGSVNKKLLAALAVLAVAFVVLAAVPAIGSDSYDSDAAATSLPEADSNGVITLEGNVTLSTEPSYTTGSTTIDLNGYTLSTPRIVVSGTDTPTLTVKDSSEGKTGKMILNGTGFSAAGSLIQVGGNNPGKLVVDAVTMIATQETTGDTSTPSAGNEAKFAYAIYASTNATVEITDAKITADYSALSGNGLQSGSVATIKGGVYESLQSAAIFWPSSESLAVEDATLKGVAGIDVRAGTVSLKDVDVVITKERDAFATSGPIEFNVGVGVFSWSENAYLNPSVTIQNVDVSTAKSTIKADAEIYYGLLEKPSSYTVENSYSTMVTAAASASSTALRYANLTINDSDGSALYTFAATEANLSYAQLSLDTDTGDLTVTGDSKLVSAALTTASGTTLTIVDGADVTVGSTLTSNGSIAVQDNGSIYTSDEGKISLASGSTLTLEADGAKQIPAVDPVVFTAKAASVVTSASDGKFGMDSGNVELTAGRLVIPESGSITLTKGTFTVAKDAVLDASASTAGIVVATESNTGVLNVNGEILFQKLTVNSDSSVALGASSTTKYVGTTDGITLSGNGSAKAKITQASGAVIATNVTSTVDTDLSGLTTVSLYEIKNASSNTNYTLYYSGLKVETSKVITYAVAGETVAVDVTPSDGYIVNGVYYSTSTANKAGLVSGYTYSFVAPAYSFGITVTATVGGAFSASFYLVYDDGTADELYKVQSGLTSSDKPAIPAEPVRTGYYFVGWYTDEALSKEAVSGSELPAIGTSGSVTYYGKMIAIHDVTTSKTGEGSLVASPAQAVYNGSVTIKATPAEGWALTSLTVDGVAVDIKNTYKLDSSKLTVVKDSTYDKYTGSAYTYYIYMPDKDVAVSAVFKELYDVSWTNPEKVGGTALATDKGITAVDMTGKQYLAGDTVKVTIGAPDNYAVADVIVTGADSAVLKMSNGDVKVVTKNSKTTYDFTMPAQDVVVTASYNTKAVLNLTADANGTMTALGKTTSTTSKYNASVDAAIGSTVLITFTPSDDTLAVATLKIAGASIDISKIEYEDGVGSYSYTVPAGTAAGASIAINATFGPVHSVKKVTQAGDGDVVYDLSTAKGVAGSKVSFTVRSISDVTLNKIVVSQYVNATTEPTIKETWIINGTPSTASGTTEVSKSTMWTVTGDVYTFKMQDYDVVIDFVFGDAVYYPITISEGSEVEVYKDSALKEQVPDLSKAVAGTYYIVVKQKEGYDVNNASAKFTTTGGPVTSEPNVTPVTYTYTAGNAVPLTRISLSAEQGVYSFDLEWDTTITAGYKAHTSTVTIEQPVNGKIVVTVGDKEISTGDLVDYDSVLTITATADSGYSVTGITLNGTAYSQTTYTVKMDNITIGASTAKAYAVTVKGDDGVAVTPSKTSAAEGEDIVLTIVLKSGYKLDSLTVDGTAVEVSGSSYTFKMPAKAVSIVATSSASSPAADNVTVSFVNMNGVTKVQVAAIDGYIPAGKVTITAWYSFTLAGRTVADHFDITVDIIGGEGKYVEIADITTDNEHAATLFGGSAHYVATAGDVNSYDSPMTTITLAAAEA